MESEQVHPFIRQNILPICLGVVGLVFLGIGIFQFIGPQNKEPELIFEEKKEEMKSIEVVVDVGGAVMKPGVYKLSTKNRIVDALAAAGGLSEDADRVYVEKNINLAGTVSDGYKIYIPRVGEEILAESSETGSNGPVININLASISDLEDLPGIGEVTAQKIIDGRPYTSTDDLKNMKIVGEATFEKIKDKIAAN